MPADPHGSLCDIIRLCFRISHVWLGHGAAAGASEERCAQGAQASPRRRVVRREIQGTFQSCVGRGRMPDRLLSAQIVRHSAGAGESGETDPKYNGGL